MTARFTQEDTYRGDVMDVRSLNLYAYCANDPVNFVDPSGHEREVVSIEKTSRTSPSGKVFVTTTTTMSNGTKYKVTRSAENDSLSGYIIRGGGQIVSVGDYVNSGGTSEKGEWNLESVTAYGQAMAEANEKGEFVTYDRWADQFHKNSDIEIGGREDICETIYTLSLGEKQDRQAAEEFVLDLTENDPALAKEFIQYYVNKSGGMKLAPDNFYQTLYDAGPINRHEGNEPGNMYDDYTFDLFDALGWLVDTAGNMNFVMQTRPMAAEEQAAEKQFSIINKYDIGLKLLESAGYLMATPKFFIGSLEYEAAEATEPSGISIYNMVVNRMEETGISTDMIAGMYYSYEYAQVTEANLSLMKKASDFIHAKNQKMIWMPWYGKDTKDLETMIGNEYFDAVLIQSGIFFMEEYNEEKAKDRMTNTIKFVQRMRKEGGRTNVGLMYEYDTSAYTGRVYMPEEDMKEHPYVTAGNKKALLNMYLRMINEARMQDGDMLIGLYSGGPNEQGYNNPYWNNNPLNTGNHIPYLEERDNYKENLKKYNHTPFSAFPGAYPGNFIYDFNRYILHDIWKDSLTEFGLEKPE